MDAENIKRTPKIPNTTSVTVDFIFELDTCHFFFFLS
jgi:hypothetical protein